MALTQTVFYRFLGVHSLLIGLFPFFIPVYLWNAGFRLADISLFVAISGISFCLALRIWEITEAKTSLPALMTITLLLELALLSVILGFSTSGIFLIVFGLANGIYNCFFWTTQRTLFLDIITIQNSGRQYGNFQIFVMVFLKSGILIGGLLLEHLGFSWVFSVSTVIVIISIAVLWMDPTGVRQSATDTSAAMTTGSSVTLKQVHSFRDQQGSRKIFVIDGFYLFLESHFWTISLFLVTQQNFARLGIMVIVLAVLFAVLFYVAKNSIDRIMGKRIYQAAVLMYSASWLLRTAVSEETQTQWLLVLLLIITFFSSFFRLAFNKRFYDIAKMGVARDYLIIKSYYTQCAVVVIFGVLAAVAVSIKNDQLTLQIIYVTAGAGSLLYLAYRQIDNQSVTRR